MTAGAVAADPVVVVRGGAIGYADRPVVRDVDLTLHRGEVVALVGPNGSGKTTLVRGLLGLAQVLDGEVELFGTPSGQFRQRWRVGYVPQRHTVGGGVPSTVEEVVGSGRLPRRRLLSLGSREDRRVVAEAVATVGLTDRRRADVATLSGGQQRRVLIARALASEPEILVMDEPTAGVDAAGQESLTRTLDLLVRSGLTLLVVTHDVAPLMPILTRVVLLHDGRVTRDEPASRFFAAQGGPASVVLPGDHHHPEHEGDPRSAVPGWLGDPGLGDLRVDDLRLGRRGTGS